MAQQIRQRKQQTLTLNAFGAKVVQQLGRGMIYRELALRLSGTLTFAAGASNAVANLGRGDEWSIIDKIEIIKNGSDVVRSMTGTQLRFLNRLFYGTTGRLSTTWGDGSTAAPSYDSTLILPFWQPLSVKPMDTALDSSRCSDLRIEVTLSSAAAITTGTAPTSVAGTLDVISLESFGVDFLGSECKIFPLQQVVSGATPAYQFPLPVTSLYRGFFINVANGANSSSSDLPSAVTNIIIKSGTTPFRDIPFPVLRDWQRQRLGWCRELVQNVAATKPVTGSYQNIVRSSLADEDAWVFLDLVQDGYMAEGIDSVGFSEIFLEFNVAAACTITVLPVQIFPRRARQVQMARAVKPMAVRAA